MNKLFVFDLDDTLIDNVHDYAKPILDAAWLIIQTLGAKAPHVSKIIAMEQEIDLRRVKEINPDTGKPFLYSMERFPGSLVSTYNEICQSIKMTPIKETQKKLYDIGLMAFDKEMYYQNIKPYALELIHFLSRWNDELILYTKGDERVQNNKIIALAHKGVMQFFTDIVIADQKNANTFAKFATRCSGRCYSVGNSFNADIAPALATPGFSGILIPVETWDTIGKTKFESADNVDNLYVLDNLAQIMDIYPRL